MEERVVEISYELWKQMLTQGYTSGGYRCVEGLPQDAKLIEVFWKENGPGRLPSLCAAFLAEEWTGPDWQYTIQSPRTAVEYKPFKPVLVDQDGARCDTCWYWQISSGTENRKRCARLGIWLMDDFGCVKYKPRATDD